MNLKFSALAAIGAVALSCSPALAVDATSGADKTFVAMVSQGGLFETKLGEAASTQGSTQDIKDQGATEAHDHSLVNAKLKSIVEAAGLTISSTLNPIFAKKLASLTALSGTQFDNAYLAAMADIHAKDGAAFEKEASAGTDPKLKAFAAETHVIVLRHIGEIKAVGPTSP